MRRLLLSCSLTAAAALLALPTSAQTCVSGTLIKNDNLPDVPAGQTTLSIIPGLCEGEAAGAVFDLPPSGAPQKISKVAVGFANSAGATGATALIDVEIYDGVSFAGSQAVLGPKVFDLSDASGANFQISSGGINEVDLSQYDVVVGNSGNNQYVVAFRMDFNPNGNCAAGYQTNFFTDNDQPGLFGCNPTTTPAGRNLIDILGQGWQDASLATVTGVPLCPLFYSGNWAIRACVEDTTPTNPVNVTITGGAATPGGFLNLSFNAPGFVGDVYAAAAALGTSPGIPIGSGDPLVVQTLPLNPDALFSLSLAAPGTFLNFFGTIGAGGAAPGVIIFPNSPSISGLSFFVAFVTLPAPPAVYGVSTATQIQVL